MEELFRPGNALRVKSLKYGSKSCKMLIDMGITPDTTIHIDHAAPFGEPLIVSVRNYKLALRKKDLQALVVELSR